MTRNREETIFHVMKKNLSPIPSILAVCLAIFLWGSLQGCCTSQTDDNYPLKVCVVSGEELGSMGDPHVHEHNGTLVKFCCPPCLDTFNEDPDKYLAKLKE